MAGISVWSLLLIAVIVLLLFGSRRIRTLGEDLGAAIKGLRSAAKEGDEAIAELKDEQA